MNRKTRKSCDYLFVVHRLQAAGQIKPGGVDRIIDFVLAQGRRVAILENPLKGSGPARLIFRQGDSTEVLAQIRIPLGGPSRWLLELLLTPNLANAGLTGDYTIICADPLNFAAARPLMRIGRKSIFLVVDYSPQRFSNRIFNSCYQKVFRSAIKRADQVWAASRPGTDLCRTLTDKPEKVHWLPNSPYCEEFPQLEISRRNLREMVLVGHLSDSTNLGLIARALAAPQLQEAGMQLTVIGPGERKEEIFRRWGVAERVRFLGLLPRAETLAVMTRGGIGLAFYGGRPELDRFRDSLKIREYAAAGLPVICDGITPTAREGKEWGACFIVDTPEQLAETAARLINDPDKYARAARASRAWAGELDKAKLLQRLLASEVIYPCAE